MGSGSGTKARVISEERRRSNERLKRAYADLERRVQERTAEYQELVNTVDGIVWEAKVGKPGYTLVSRQAERILGYPIVRWLNEPRFWQSILHPDDHARMTGEKYIPPHSKKDSHIEYRVRTATGKILWMKDYVKVIYEGGKPSKMRGLMVDITDRKKAEEKLREAQIATIRAASIKEQFLANMSHEIRTPLNAIVGMASVGLGAATLNEEQKDCLATIKTAADSLLLIVNDILDYSKIEAGKMELEVGDFGLRGLCRNTLDVISPLAKSKGIELKFDISPTLVDDLRGDAGRLMQVLMNLLSNAVKFTQAGGSVCLKVAESGRRIRFEVRDTGTGIPDEIKEKLFRPFSQGDPSTARKYGGTGLGLSISKCLVGLMGGEIGVESALGLGSTFWLEIALERAEGPIRSQNELATEPDPKCEKPLRILVVDDNFTNQKVVTSMLENLGHHSEAVANGEEAVTSYQRGKYDLILMDCQMPEVDGYEATRRIRRLEAASGKERIPIIALTAHALSGDRKKCEDAGMDDYLSKPVDLRQLRAALMRKRLGERVWISDLVASPSVDHDHLRSLETLQASGKPDIIRELVEYFLGSAPTALTEIRNAYLKREFETLEKVAHKLKSTCYNVGAKRLALLCERVENHEIEGLDRIIEELPLEFEKVSLKFRDLLLSRSA